MNAFKTTVFDCLSSTQDYLRARPDDKDVCVIAKRQKSGKGTKGRSFSSEKGGVYLSFRKTYANLQAKDAFQVMASAAVAVCKTVESYGVTPKIKWANDVFVNGKKICGILIENRLSGGFVESALVGVGLNVNNALPTELQDTAITLSALVGETPVEEVTERLLSYLCAPFDFTDYENRLGFVGEEVGLFFDGSTQKAIFLGVDRRGNLRAQIDGEEKTFSAVELRITK